MARSVLLVNTNRIKPPIAPLGLEYLAHALQRAGVSWRLLDLCFAHNPEEALARELAQCEPLLVALTLRNTDDCYFATQHSFLGDVAALVRVARAQSAAPVVVGGSGYSVAPAGLLRRLGADFGIVGDGERALVQLAQALECAGDVAEIAGLVWRSGEEVHVSAPRWEEFGEESLPRDAVDNARYFREGGQGSVETKRGCPKRCVYCADPLSKGRRPRLRPPRAVVGEIRRLLAQGVDCLHLCDSEFNIPPEHAREVCQAIIEAGLGERLRWYAYCSPVPFSRELARLMRRAGCVGLNFGVDSAHSAMLRALGREHTPEDLRQVVAACREAGIACMFDLLLGGPGETRETVRETIEQMKRLSPDCVGVALGVRIYPGTALAQRIFGSGSRAMPGVHGAVEGNADLALPVFYLDPALGDDIAQFVVELIAGDTRFFFSWPESGQVDYNYDGNPLLVQAIAAGERGAYWDILRKISASR